MQISPGLPPELQESDTLFLASRLAMTAEKSPFTKYLTHFKKGHVLFREGDPGEEMYIIQSGRIFIKKKIKDHETTLAVLEKGDFLGEMAVLERLPRSATAELMEDAGLIVINIDTLGDMIKSNPEIAIRMLRKYSIRLRETNKQLEQLLAKEVALPASPAELEPPMSTAGTLDSQALAYFISPTTGNVFPVFNQEALIGRLDSVTGMRPEIDLTNEDQSRNVSRRHARLVTKERQHFIAEEMGTMNGTFLNGKKLTNGVLTPIHDGDELILCRLSLRFKTLGP